MREPGWALSVGVRESDPTLVFLATAPAWASEVSSAKDPDRCALSRRLLGPQVRTFPNVDSLP